MEDENFGLGLVIGVLLWWFLAWFVDYDAVRPEQYERAVAACAPYGGLKRIHGTTVFNSDVVEAVCKGPARIDAKTLPKRE